MALKSLEAVDLPPILKSLDSGFRSARKHLAQRAGMTKGTARSLVAPMEAGAQLGKW